MSNMIKQLMVKKLLGLGVLVLAGYCSQAQVVISEGAQLVCTGNFSNTSGTITNNGKLEVQGNFVNTGSYSSADNLDSLLLTGAGSILLNGGTATYGFLSINKSTGGVTLSNNLNVGSKLHLTAGSFSTNPTGGYVLSAPLTAEFAFGSGTSIVGKVKRTSWVNGSTVAFHGADLTVVTTGGTAPTAIELTNIPAADPTGAEKEVKHYFFADVTGGTGYTASVVFPYATSELNGNAAATLAPWYYSSGEWVAKLTGNTVNTTTGRLTNTSIAAAEFAGKEWKLADPRYTLTLTAHLRGPWSGSQMNTTLRSNNILPLAQPYNLTPYNYSGTESVASIPANVTDWVLVEIRKPSSGLPADATSATVVGRRAAFILNTGSIVDLDGVTPLGMDISKQGNSYIVVRHRNHLAVMSNAIASNETGIFTNDFSALENVYARPGAASAPMVLLPSSTKFGMWPGDPNRSGTINGVDLSLIKNNIASGVTTGYNLTDINFSNSLNGLDLSLTKNSISSSASGSAPVAASNKETMTHVPN